MAQELDGRSLHMIGLETLQLFRKIRNSFVDDDQEWPHASFEAEADRFELWAVNLGLFVSGHGSLDYRLRQAEKLRGTVSRFMTSLDEALEEALEYETGQTSSSFLKDEEDDAPAAKTSNDEESQGLGSDTDLLIESVKDPIDRLYKLSTWIRNPSSRFASSKALYHQEIDPDSDVDWLQAIEKFEHDYVSSMFLQYRKSSAVKTSNIKPPGNQSQKDVGELVWEPIRTVLAQYQSDVVHNTESFLVNRITSANIRRRQQFAYWRKHRDKLAQHSETTLQHIRTGLKADHTESRTKGKRLESSALPLVSAPSITTASNLNVSQLTINDDPSHVSVSEYAPSLLPSSLEAVDFPPAPKQPEGKEYFECPYCFTICSTALLGMKAWKAHLIHDLRPYICTYENCRHPDQLYDNRLDWIQHENTHRKVFRRSEHSDEEFFKLSEYQEHVQNEDKHCRDGTSLNLIDNASQSIVRFPDRDCPICSASLTTSNAMQGHIALHLERFSLFSIPRNVGVNDVEADEVASNEANLAANESRKDDFEDDATFSDETHRLSHTHNEMEMNDDRIVVSENSSSDASTETGTNGKELVGDDNAKTAGDFDALVNPLESDSRREEGRDPSSRPVDRVRKRNVLLSNVDTAQDLAAALTTFQAHLSERAVEIKAVISELHTVSAALLEFRTALSETRNSKNKHAIDEDRYVLLRSLEHTLGDIQTHLQGLKKGAYSNDQEAYLNVWINMDNHFRNENGNSLLLRLEYYRRFMEDLTAVTEGKQPGPEIDTAYDRLNQLLYVQDMRLSQDLERSALGVPLPRSRESFKDSSKDSPQGEASSPASRAQEKEERPREEINPETRKTNIASDGGYIDIGKIRKRAARRFHEGTKVLMRRGSTEFFEFHMIITGCEYNEDRDGWDYWLKEDNAMAMLWPKKVKETNLRRQR